MHILQRCFLILCLSTACVTPVSAASPAGTVVVIVNSANTQALTLAEVRDIYTGRLAAWDNGQRVSAYNLPASSATRETFSRRILGISAAEADAQISRHQRAGGALGLQQTKSEELLVTIVSKKHTAIGYCTPAAIEGKFGIRVIATLD